MVIVPRPEEEGKRYIIMIEIKAFFGGWHPCSVELARDFVRSMMAGAAAIPETKKAAWMESKHLRGTTVAELFQ